MRRPTLLALLILATVTPTGVDADAGDAQHAVAANHYAAGRWDLAVEEFQEFLASNPEHAKAVEAKFFLAEALVQLGRYRDALSRYDEFLQTAPDHEFGRQALFRRGEAAYFNGDAETARKDLTRFTQQFPEDATAAYALPYLASAMLSLAEDHDSEAEAADLARGAEQHFQDALQRFPDGPRTAQCQLGLARAWQRQGKLAEAAEAYHGLLGNAESVIRQQAHYRLGAIHCGAGRYSEARRLLESLVDEAPQSEWGQAAHGPLAICHARQGRFDEARQAFETWQAERDIQTGGSLIAVHLAESAFDAQQWPWAEQLYRSLADSANTPTNLARGLSGLAWSQYHQDHCDEATETFGIIVQRHPDDPLAAEAAFMRAALLDKQQRSQEARAAYEFLLDSYPGYRDEPLAMFRIAVLHEAQGADDAAITAYEKLIDKHGANWPSLPLARYRLAWLLMDLDRVDAAAEQFRRVRDDHRDSDYWHDAVYRLAELASKRGDHAEARALLAESIAADPPAKMLAHALYLDARAAQATGDWEQMEQSLQRIVDEIPKSGLRATADFWLAEAAYQQDNFELSEQRFASLATDTDQLHVWRPTVLLRRAQLLALKHKWQECLALSEQLIEQYSDFGQAAEAHYLKGRSLAAQGKFSAAREAYLLAAPLDGSNKSETAAMAQWMIGESYLHQQEFQKALREYLRVDALYAYPQWQAAALLQAGTCYENLDQPQKAAPLYRQILQKYSNTKFVDDATGRLAKISVD